MERRISTVHAASRVTQQRRQGAYTTTGILFCNVIRHGLYTRVSFCSATLSGRHRRRRRRRFLVIYPGAPASGLSAISARSRPVIINAANYSANSLVYLASPGSSHPGSRAALVSLSFAE